MWCATMTDDCVKSYELEWLQEQIYELQNEIQQLQMENTLLRNDLNTIKTEGCYRFIEDPNHTHRSSNE
jgi:regulator of replication initiation timing